MATFTNTSTGRTGTIQEWTVPTSGDYGITAKGAQGGNAHLDGTTTLNPGGDGATLYGEFALTAGDVVKILVGQMGLDADTMGSRGAGGGGATFVVNETTATLLMAAGGGGGAGQYTTTAKHASETTSGKDGNRSTNWGAGAAGPNGGAGGTYPGGGGGYSGNGDNSTGTAGGYGKGGLSYTNGGTGGDRYETGTTGGHGGFGGGGGGYAGAGGGGGYGGGGGGGWSNSGDGGGGGSYFDASATNTSTTIDNADHGSVETVALNTPPTISPVTVDGTEFAGAPTLEVEVTDPDSGQTLTVTFEVYSDVGLTTLVDSGVDTLASPASSAAATYTSSVADGTFHWRAQVSDGSATSAWTTARSFTYFAPTTLLVPALQVRVRPEPAVASSYKRLAHSERDYASHEGSTYGQLEASTYGQLEVYLPVTVSVGAPLLLTSTAQTAQAVAGQATRVVGAQGLTLTVAPATVVTTTTLSPAVVGATSAVQALSVRAGQVTTTPNAVAAAFATPAVQVAPTITREVGPQAITTALRAPTISSTETVSPPVLALTTGLLAPTTITAVTLTPLVVDLLVALRAPWAGATQWVRPASDVTDGGWLGDDGGSQLATYIDEATPDDLDYITSSADPANDVAEVRLGAITLPDDRTGGWMVRCRFQRDRDPGASIVPTLQISLMEATTTIASWIEQVDDESVVEVSHALSEAEANAITDGSDLRLRLEANMPW